MSGPDETCEVRLSLEGDVCGHPLPCPQHSAPQVEIINKSSATVFKDGDSFVIKHDTDGDSISNQQTIPLGKDDLLKSMETALRDIRSRCQENVNARRLPADVCAIVDRVLAAAAGREQ